MDAKILQTLRIGDTVRIHFTHLGAGDDRRAQPFDVVIAGFNNRGLAYKEDDGRYYETRQIQWRWADMPEDLQPFESTRDNIRGLDTCSDSWITEIVERAPYQMQSQARNQLYAAEQEMFLDHQKIQAYLKAKGEDTNSFGLRQKTTAIGYRFDAYNETYGRSIGRGQYNGHVFKLAETLIARRPTLAVPVSLNADRFYTAWNQAGRPGYVGPYQPTEFSPFMRDRDHKRIDPSPYKALINRKAFTRWVVRNVHRFTMTQELLLLTLVRCCLKQHLATA